MLDTNFVNMILTISLYIDNLIIVIFW